MNRFRYVNSRALILMQLVLATMILFAGVPSQAIRCIPCNTRNSDLLCKYAVTVASGMKGDFRVSLSSASVDREWEITPDTPSADGEETAETSDTQRVKEYLDVVNSGDREAIRNYIAEHYDSSFLRSQPLDIHILFQMGIYYASAGMGCEFHSVIPSERDSLGVVLYNRLTGSWIKLNIPLTKESPQKISGFPSMNPMPPPSGVPQSQKLRDEEITERIELCLAKLVEDDEFSGVVVLARNGKPVFQKAYGSASKSYQVPNLLDTKFNIASVGKMFTGVAIAQLAERGKLSLEDPLNKYVSSDWLKPEFSQKIQIRHLLTHTSGLGNYFQKLFGQQKQLLFRNLDDYKILIADETLSFEPGTKWAYSSTGMMLLGVVIEKITGGSYFDYVRSQIYEPAGMMDTEACEKDLPVENRATGYMKDYSIGDGAWREVLYTRVMKGMPSGGSYSTAEDLLRFDVAIRSHKLLGPAYTEAVLTPKPEINAPAYGYGFFVTRNDAGRVASHGGDGSGVNCQYKMYLDSGYTVIVLSNYSPPAANIVEQVIEQMILAQ